MTHQPQPQRILDVQPLATDQIPGDFSGAFSEANIVVVHRVALRVIRKRVQSCNKRVLLCKCAAHVVQMSVKSRKQNCLSPFMTTPRYATSCSERERCSECEKEGRICNGTPVFRSAKNLNKIRYPLPTSSAGRTVPPGQPEGWESKILNVCCFDLSFTVFASQHFSKSTFDLCLSKNKH